jgi:hypothetical protein
VDGQKKREFYAPLKAVWEATFEDVDPATLLAMEKPPFDLVLCNDESWPDAAACLPMLERRGIPSLHLCDGILEWRNQWERERGPLFRPAFATRIACLGAAQARWLEAFGNGGRCVVTGSPRFDAFLDMAPVEDSGRLRVLVATARTPYFGREDRGQLIPLLEGLRAYAGEHPNVEFRWRLTGDLPKILQLPPSSGAGLREDLEWAGALFTTPSSMQLEGMLARRPVVLIDPFDRPLYVPAAWYLRRRDQIAEVVGAVRRPDERRMEHQEFVLRDELRCDGPAAPRVAALGTRMAAGEWAVESESTVIGAARESRLVAENERLRQIANRTVAQVLYRSMTALERVFGKR